jgi:hypothetical protein
MNLSFRLGQAYDSFLTGDVRGLLRRVRNRLYSETVRVGIRKELTAADEARSATAEHQVRIASMGDIEAVLDPGRGGATDANELWQRRLRRHVAATVGPSRCYVADCGDLGPSFMQFIFFSEDNDVLQAELPDLGPPIEPGEAMVDYLYVAPDARSLPFVTTCLLQVAVEARRRGATSIITYTPIGNRAALLSSNLAGYRPFALRRSRYRLFRRRVSYEPYTESISSG